MLPTVYADGASHRGINIRRQPVASQRMMRLILPRLRGQLLAWRPVWRIAMIPSKYGMDVSAISR
eukprot:scaffold67359_cov18-Prasinocladus_malaysianus.AAC.1